MSLFTEYQEDDELPEGELCVYGVVHEDGDRAEVVIKATWPGGGDVAIDCIDAESAERMLNAIEENSNPGLVTVLRA